jgi:uncharacterized protein (DUF1919 family)
MKKHKSDNLLFDWGVIRDRYNDVSFIVHNHINNIFDLYLKHYYRNPFIYSYIEPPDFINLIRNI